MLKLRHLGLINLALIVMLTIMVIPTVFAQEIGSGGIGGRPAYPREDNPRSKSIFVHTLNPGESVNEGVTVINNSNEQKSVIVYPADSIVSSGGAFACEQFVDDRNEVGSWITMDKNKVTLESADSETVDFTITVPGNADVGEHNGCIVMQSEESNADVNEGIGLNFRSAIRVAILVPGDIVKKLDIIKFSPNLTKDKLTLTTSIENTGNVSVDSDIQTFVKTIWGSTVSIVGGEYPVLRGETGEWNFDHERPFWGGWYKTNVSATYDSNVDNFIGENQDISTVKLEYPAVTIFVLPHILALAIELMVLAVAILLIAMAVKKVREKRAIKKTWLSYTVKPGQDIKYIAKARNISWRKLAKANRLKAPYTLEPGKTIKIPPKQK